MICIFDCETIPDASLIRKVYGFEGSDLEVSELALKEQEKNTGSSFLPVAFHQVVAISAVICDDFGNFIKVSSMNSEDEQGLINDFLGFVANKTPRLISFNGRNFDMPMLLTRALKYNISCPAYFSKDDRKINITKWENYRSRYDDRFHLDLMDSISEYGATRGLKLDVLCSMAGMPGKFDVSGDQVINLFYENKIEQIKQYCESDVLNTFWLFLKYEILKGNLTLSDYLNSLELMSEKIDSNKSYAKVFKEAVLKEIEKLDKI